MIEVVACSHLTSCNICKLNLVQIQESNPQLVLCKPKLLPLNSVTLEKLERMQKEANIKAKEMQAEVEKEQEAIKEGFIGGKDTVSESMTIHHDDE